MSSLYSHVTFGGKPKRLRLWGFRAPPLREIDCLGRVWVDGVCSDAWEAPGPAGDDCPCGECGPTKDGAK